MTKEDRNLLLGVALVAVGLAGYWWFTKQQGTKAATGSKPRETTYVFYVFPSERVKGTTQGTAAGTQRQPVRVGDVQLIIPGTSIGTELRNPRYGVEYGLIEMM